MTSPVLSVAKSPPPKSPTFSVTRRNPHCWSELPLDLMQLVFERLGFSDFQRAKSVCSSWQSGSKQSKPNNKIPWMIFFPSSKNYCLLFNPEDKEKLYKTQHLGDDFAKSSFLATYGSWLLMQSKYEAPAKKIHTSKHNLYILDLLTRKRISLPPLESRTGLCSPILWIGEKTKDYLVLGTVDQRTLVSFKKGDNSWKQISELPSSCIDNECFNMVYKDHKLYCLNYSELLIFYFSREFSPKLFKISVRGYINHSGGLHSRYAGLLKCVSDRWKYNVIVTVRGDVLIVRSFSRSMSLTWDFRIYKMDSSKRNKWEEIFSLGDESIILDLGITVLAKDVEGITSNSIYFSANDIFDIRAGDDIFIYNLETKKVEKPYQFVYSSIPAASGYWFLPSFNQE